MAIKEYRHHGENILQAHIPYMAEIVVATHFFAIIPKHIKAKDAIWIFATPLLEYKWEYDREKRRNVKLASKVWGGTVSDLSSFRYPISLLPRMLKILEQNGIEAGRLNIIHLPRYVPAPADVEIKDHFNLYDYQEEAHAFTETQKEKFIPSVLLNMPTGTGKAQPLSSLIRTPGGWSTMKEMYVGKEIIAADGTTTKVKAIFPQGLKSNYRVTFSDNRTAECCDEHLWKVHVQNKTGTWSVVTTAELIKLKKDPKIELHIPLYTPDKGINKVFEIAPYDFGLSLGFGKEVDFTTYKLFRTYLEGSYLQRLSLVQGLMDANGSVSFKGTLLYYCSDRNLITGVQSLVRSLGGIAKVTETTVNFEHSNKSFQGTEEFRLEITYKNPRDLFKSVTKKEKIPLLKRNLEWLKLGISSIEYIGKKEMQCISIEHPDQLYVTDGYVVTHNTITLLAYVAKVKLRTAIVASATYSEKWKADILNNTKTTEDRINLVSGRTGIKKIFAAAEEGGYDKDFTILSIETLHRFFKEYEENQELCAEIYGGTPVDLWEKIECGILGGDEMHENLNAIYWLNTFIHGPFHIGLSATMLHKDPFVEARQLEIYPAIKRFDKIKMKKYINFVYFGYAYKDFDRSKIKTSFPGKSTYAQDAYEQSIMMSKASRDSFIEMVVHTVKEYYIDKKKPGDKLRVYFSRIKMIDMITEALQVNFPDLDINRYAESDEYSIIIDSDIAVTNRGKAGTGVDIPGLTTVINFTNVESSQAVLQLLGRLRDIKDKDVFFIQAYCKNIKKHMQYKDNCHTMINERVKGYVHHDYKHAL